MSDEKVLTSKVHLFADALGLAAGRLLDAYDAVVDRGEQVECAKILDEVRRTLCAGRDDLPPLRIKESGISTDSLRMTVLSISSTAGNFIMELATILADDANTMHDAERWVDSRGQTALRGLSVLIGNLLCEQNLYKLIA